MEELELTWTRFGKLAWLFCWRFVVLTLPDFDNVPGLSKAHGAAGCYARWRMGTLVLNGDAKMVGRRPSKPLCGLCRPLQRQREVWCPTTASVSLSPGLLFR